MSKLVLEDLIEHVTTTSDYEASSVIIGDEQKAASQYPLVTTPQEGIDNV